MASPRKLLIPVSLALFALSGWLFWSYDHHHPKYVTTAHGATGGYSILGVIAFFWVAIGAAICLVAAFGSRSSLAALTTIPWPARTRTPARAASARSRPAP